MSLKDYLNNIESITNKIVSDNCYNHETVDVLSHVMTIQKEVEKINNVLLSGYFKGDKGETGPQGPEGKPGTASLAIDDDTITKASTWSSEKINTLNYNAEQEIVTDRAFSFDTKNGFIEILSIRGHSMIIGGEMVTVSNGKGLEITTYNAQREDTKQLLYFDTSENTWKKIKQLNGNDECYDSVEYDINKGTYKYVKRCKLDGNTITPLEEAIEYKANMLNLSTYDPNTSLRVNSTFFPTIRFHVHTKLHDNVLKNKERLSNLESGLQKLTGRGSLISDDEISKRKTWSSQKLSSLISGKPIAPPPVNHVVKVSDKHIPNTGEGLFKDFAIDGKTLVNTIPKSSETLRSNGAGIGITTGRMITPKVKLPEHSQVTLLVRCEKDSEDITAKIGGTYIDEITLEPGLRTYTTNINMSNGVLQPYITNNFVPNDSVKIEVLSLVDGDIQELTEFDGMKSVGFDKGIYLESIKADGNIFNSYLKPGRINPLSGAEIESEDYLVSGFLFVRPGAKYSWSLFDEFSGTIYEYDDRKNYIKKNHNILDKSSAVFSGSYVKIQFNTKDKKLLFMLNEGEKRGYEVPIFNRTQVLYKDNGKWKPVTQLRGVNGVQDSIVKHTDNKYYLHERVNVFRSTDLVNPQKKEEIVDRDIWYFDVTSNRLGETIGDATNLLIQCDKLTPMPVSSFTSIEHDYTNVIGYAPVVKKVYISLPKNQESDIIAYLQRVNFEFIIPVDEVIYEVNPIYLRSYHPMTNISLRGSVIVPQYEFNNEVNLQKIAHENIIRLQQIESELFKANGVGSIHELDTRVQNIEKMVLKEEYLRDSNESVISANIKNGNVCINSLHGRTLVNLWNLQSVEKSKSNISIDNGYVKTVADGTFITPSSKNISGVQPNTIYTVIFDILKNTCNGNTSLNIDYNNESCFADNIIIESGKTGILTYKIRSKSDLSLCKYLIRTQVQSGSTSGEFVYRCMVIEGQEPLSNITYFEGLRSVGNGIDGLELLVKNNSSISCKQKMLFKDIDGNLKPLTQLRGINGLYDNVMLNIDNKYYYHKNTDMFELTGTENFTNPTTLGSYFRVALNVTDKNVGNGECISNNLPYDVNYDKQSRHFYIRDNYLYIFLKLSELTTHDINGVKKWIQDNRFTIIYPLKTQKIFEVNPLILNLPNENNIITLNDTIVPTYLQVKITDNITNIVNNNTQCINWLSNNL